MAINVDTNLITIISLGIAVLSLVFAVWQAARSRNLKTLHEEKCGARAKDLFALVSALSDHAHGLCRQVDTLKSESSVGDESILRILPDLAGKAEAILSLVGQLIRFCERLNDEHLREFRRPAIENLRERLKVLPCMRFIERQLQATVEDCDDSSHGEE